MSADMNTDPFAVEGDARDREEALFEFLVAQVRSPDSAAWERLAKTAGRQEDAGYLALLLSNLAERWVPDEATTALYAVATQLLAEKLRPASFARWLRKGRVDVQRLSDHLDHELAATA